MELPRKIVMLNGSPRGSKSVTGLLLEHLATGLEEGGASVVRFKIDDLKIVPCTGCLSCMHKTPGRCVLKDDMGKIYEQLKASDLLVVGTPVYTDTMSAQLKIVMDRLVCSMQPFLRRDSRGRVRHTFWWRIPARSLLVSTSGFPEKETFDPLVATFRAEMINSGSDLIGEICIPGSLALQMSPARMEHHLVMLRDFGSRLAATGEADEALLSALNEPPLTVEEYLTIAAQYEAWCREKLGIPADQPEP